MNARMVVIVVAQSTQLRELDRLEDINEIGINTSILVKGEDEKISIPNW